jgi:hypothetical protein
MVYTMVPLIPIEPTTDGLNMVKTHSLQAPMGIVCSWYEALETDTSMV